MPGSIPERRIVLASTSRYRRELLDRLRLPYVAVAPGIDEQRHDQESPHAMVARLAAAKADAAAADYPDALSIGSDQVALVGAQVLGKPGTTERAVGQLQLASGNTVQFLTAVCVVDTANGRQCARTVTTEVQFRTLSRGEIDAYVAAELPLDCAGSFKSEGLGICLFERISSDDPTALIGLPLIATLACLRRLGVDPLRPHHRAAATE